MPTKRKKREKNKKKKAKMLLSILFGLILRSFYDDFLFFLFICLGSEEYLTSHGRAAENMTKMKLKNLFFLIMPGLVVGVCGTSSHK